MTPIVLVPAGFDIVAEWKKYEQAQDALAANPEDFGAAMCADPGICSCPACDAMYWAFGHVQQCVACGFIYPTNAWCAFSWGTSASGYNDARMNHPYYRYAYEHHRDARWPHTPEVMRSIDWRAAVGDFPLEGELWRL